MMRRSTTRGYRKDQAGVLLIRLSGVGMVRGQPKFAGAVDRQCGSSPKLRGLDRATENAGRGTPDAKPSESLSWHRVPWQLALPLPNSQL
jgi:hypothetical protein